MSYYLNQFEDGRFNEVSDIKMYFLYAVASRCESLPETFLIMSGTISQTSPTIKMLAHMITALIKILSKSTSRKLTATRKAIAMEPTYSNREL